jgi:anti-anti-sigma factor
MTLEDGAAGLGWDGHLLLLHRSELERRSQLAGWVRRGLARDEQVICTQTETESPQRSVLAVLSQHGIDARAATAEGRLLVLPPTAIYPVGVAEQLERIERALAEGYRGIRISGEASAALTAVSEQAYADLERLMDQLCRAQPVSALCQYEGATTTGARLEQATAAHRAGIRESQLHTAEADGGLILAGEVDWSNEPVLLAAVRAATSPATTPAATSTVPGTLRIDLRRVSFLSAGGCHALAVGTQQFRDRGGGVLLVAPQPIVERVLRLYGLDALLHWS